MRYYLDTEFWERPGSIQLISIGIVAEDGREHYAENKDFVWGDCTSDWLHENVKPHLEGGESLISYADIGPAILEFIQFDLSTPEFWAYYADYDWVVFCWLFGSMIDLPTGWPMFCMDLKQEVYKMGNPELPPQDTTEHNALHDAKWLRLAYDYVASHA